jgi:hypothetical protein
MIEYRRLESDIAPRAKVLGHQFKRLHGLRCQFTCLLGFGAFNSNRVMRDIKVVNEEARRLVNGPGAWSNLLPQPLPPVSGRVQTVVFGRDKERDHLVQMLIQPIGKAIISLVGAGGIGKTTLAQMVSNNARVRQHFDVICWVSVSSVSSKMELAAEILRSAQPAWDGSAEKMVDFQMLQSELRRFVTSKRYLIVLDGVCNSTDAICSCG